MSQNKSLNPQKSYLLANNDYDNDDLVSLQVDSKTINFTYSQLVKYSKHIREKYVFSDVINNLPQEIHNFSEEFQLSSENIFYFFQLIMENYVINENTKLTYIQCIDLLKISKYFEVRKLKDLINAYIKDHNIDADFIIQMIQYEINTQNENDNFELEINPELENLLTSRVYECLSNEKFSELPISFIYRIIKQSSLKSNIDCDKIFDFIKKSISKFYVLFSFIDLEKLSNDRIEELCDIYSNSNESDQQYFNYLKCNLNKIDKMNKNTKNLEIQLKSFQKTNQDQQNQLNELESKIIQLQQQLKESLKEKDKVDEENKALQNKLTVSEKNRTQIEEEKSQIQKKLEDSEKIKNEIEEEKNQIQKKLEDSEKIKNEIEEEKNQIQKKLEDSEKIKNNLQKQLEEKNCQINGKVIASVKNGLIIIAKINLIQNESLLDTSKSKYIISKSDMKEIGASSYTKGEPITSLQMNTNEFICKSGTYYVRCLVFDQNGNSREIVSNPVTTSGKSISFSYEGIPKEISLLEGRYKLEVWGAKGGDSDGMRDDSQPGKGGLGGYSRGILTLNEAKKVHIYVGGEGKSGSLQEGAITNGGFPDGGSTKTGHFNDHWKTSPGTGGGSTSIRLGSESEYSRVIVAGGGGAVSSRSWRIWRWLVWRKLHV